LPEPLAISRMAKDIENEIAVAECRRRILAVVVYLPHGFRGTPTIAHIERENVVDGQKAPWPQARSYARVGHLIDHRPADFEAWARRITGGPAVGLMLDAHR
jgi:hypothetical protein